MQNRMIMPILIFIDKPRCQKTIYYNVFGGDKVMKAFRVSSQQQCEEACSNDPSCSAASHLTEGQEQWCGLYKDGHVIVKRKTNSILIDFTCKQGTVKNLLIFV